MKPCWRVGSKVRLNVYDEDGKPVCQCHTEADAVRIVTAVNFVAILREKALLLPQKAEDRPEGVGD